MPQDLVITPNRGSTTSGAQIAFTGYSGASSIYLKVLPDSSLSFEGSAGQLFSITDNLSSGTIFSVNDITGIPSFDVNANGLVRIAPYAGNVALGTTATSGRLQINTGSATTIGQIIVPASGQTANLSEWRNLSGAVVSYVNGSGLFGGSLASGSIVAGSSGQMQFNAGGTLGASAAVTFSSGTSHLNVAAQATNIVPLRITVQSGHSTSAFQVIGSGSLIGAQFDATGVLYCSQYTGAGSNTLINATIPDNTMQRSVIIGQGAYSSSGQIGELVAIGYGAGANRYGVGIGQSASAAANSIAIGLQASASNATVSVAIGQLSNAAFANSCGIGSRATPAAAGDFVWASELQNPTIRTQRFDASNNISYLFAGASTWIDSTAATKTSRFTLSTYYTTSAQEAIRIDSASDLARVGIGGAASGRLCVYTGVAGNKGIVVQGFTSQTANLTEWQNSAGSNVASMNASGALIASYAGFGGAIPSGSYRLDVSGLANLGGIVFDGGTCSFPSLSAGSYPTSLYINNTTKGHGIRVDKNQGGDVDSSIAAFYASVTNTYANNPVGFFAVSNSAGCKPMIARGSASQTANLQEWQNSAGSVIARINASGEFFGLIASGIVTSGEIGNAAVVSGNIASGAVGAYHFNATGLASGKTLSTDGTGVLSWATGGGGGPTISDDTSTNATRYVNFAAATTGTLSTIYTSSTKLTFNPSTGDFTAGGNITANSDIKIKTDIKTIENALEKVNNLRGVSFTRIGTNIKNIGVIAQEVETVAPELVRESDGLKSVAYGNITALLIEAIKEQTKKIEELEKKICQLTSNPS